MAAAEHLFETAPTRAELDHMVELAVIDPERDEELYAAGLRKLVLALIGGVSNSAH